MKVLFATDGSDPAQAAAELLARVADKSRVELSVMSVTHSGMPELEEAPFLLDPIEARRENTLALVDHWTAWFQDQGFHSSAKVAEGRPGQEIVRAVEDDWFDLTVLGSGRSSWLGQRLLGSVSTHVLHSSPSSVLIVHHAKLGPDIPRLLVAVDGSRGCEFAARAATGMTVPSAKIRVVSCFAPVTAFMVPGAVGSIPVVSGDSYDKAMSTAERRAAHFADEFRTAGYETETAAVWGHPHEQILKETESFGADIVVVGSRGLGPLKRALLGSVSDQVVRHAPATLVGRRLT